VAKIHPKKYNFNGADTGEFAGAQLGDGYPRRICVGSFEHRTSNSSRAKISSSVPTYRKEGHNAEIANFDVLLVILILY
jgi:hypothetical protein